MTRYLLSKLGQAIVTIVLVVLVVFTLLRFMPTAGYFSKEQYKTMTDAEKTEIEEFNQSTETAAEEMGAEEQPLSSTDEAKALEAEKAGEAVGGSSADIPDLGI